MISLIGGSFSPSHHWDERSRMTDAAVALGGNRRRTCVRLSFSRYWASSSCDALGWWIPATKIHGGGCYWKTREDGKPYHAISYRHVFGHIPATKIHGGGGGYWKTREYMKKGWNRSFRSQHLKNTRQYGKKGHNHFFRSHLLRNTANFRKYNWILFTKFSNS